MSLALMAACIWFAVFLLVKWTWFAILDVGNRGIFIVRLFALIVLLQTMSTVFFASRAGWGLEIMHAVLVAMLSMSCLFVLYMPFYYTVAASLSVHSVIKLRKAGGRMNRGALEQIFASREVVRRRLQTMVASGYLSGSDNCYRITERGRFVAATFKFMKAAWNLGAGG